MKEHTRKLVMFKSKLLVVNYPCAWNLCRLKICNTYKTVPRKPQRSKNKRPCCLSEFRCTNSFITALVYQKKLTYCLLSREIGNKSTSPHELNCIPNSRIRKVTQMDCDQIFWKRDGFVFEMIVIFNLVNTPRRTLYLHSVTKSVRLVVLYFGYQ